MTAVTLDDVHRALESVPDPDGVIVAHALEGGKVKRLAYRPPLEGGAACLIVLGAEPFAYPDRPPPLRLDARRPAEPASQGAGRGREADHGKDRGTKPPSPPTGPERPEDLTLLADDRD